MNRTIFLSGGTGFVGQSVARALLASGYSIRALVNDRPIEGLGANVENFPGGLFDPNAVDRAMAGCTAAIHLVGIIFEHRRKGITFERIHVQGTAAVLAAAKKSGVSRYVQMSALGARPDSPAEYHRTKFAAEQLVRGSGLSTTIFRPSMIHGPRGQFMRTEMKWITHRAPPFLFMPYFGKGALGLGGSGQVQPVYVEDVARAFVEALDRSETVGQVYPLVGPERMDWPTLHRTVATAVVGKPRIVAPLPAWVGRFYAAIGIAPLLGFNRDQVEMSQDDNTADDSTFARDFGWHCRGMTETMALYAESLK